jgi:hypothetical protein
MVRRWIFNLGVPGSNPVGAGYIYIFCFVFYIQMFFYTIMNIFITLLKNVNKSRTSAGSLSLMPEVLQIKL